MWFQLPTPRDGGDSRREVPGPESKLLGRPREATGLGRAAGHSPGPAGVLSIVTGGVHSQPAARDTLLMPAQP